VKLDTEERILATPDDEVEFTREGYAKVTITISRELVEQARALDMTTRKLFAEAIRLAVPGAFR
jgi:hypothetical protein